MSSPSSSAPIAQKVLVLRCIHAGLVIGAMSFLAFAYYDLSQRPAAPGAGQKEYLTTLMLGFATAGVMGSFMLSYFMAQSARWELMKGTPSSADDPKATGGDDAHWLAKYFPIFLVRMSLIEAGAMGLTMAYYLDGSWVTFGGAIVLILILVVQFPRANVLREWIESQRAQVLAVRQSSVPDEEQENPWPDI
jgi:hypothetical protein